MKPTLLALSASLLFLTPFSLTADVFTTTPSLPTSPPAYYGNNTTVLTYLVPGGGILRLRNFTLANWDPNHSTFNGSLTFSASPDPIHFLPVNAAGSTAWLNNNPQTTGTFATEMIQLGVSGGSAYGPISLRESPTLASTGQTSVTDLGGGQFSVTSFFDVFTELSLDGGINWAPANTTLQLDLQTVPEPTAAALLTLALSAIALRQRWQTRG